MSSASAPKPATAFGNFFDRAGMLVVLAILFLACAFGVDNFFSWANMKGLALAVSMTGMVSCTMLFCLAAGDFDLSVGSVVACAGVLAAEQRGQDVLHVPHGMPNALPAVARLVAVAQLLGLPAPGRGTGRHGGLSDAAVVELHFDLDRRIASRIEDFMS